jgi:hypothetical protein
MPVDKDKSSERVARIDQLLEQHRKKSERVHDRFEAPIGTGRTQPKPAKAAITSARSRRKKV